MRASDFLGRLRELFLAAGRSPDGDAHTAGLTGIDAPDQTEISRRFVEQLDQQGVTSIMTGCVLLLGLDRVKLRLGRKWAAFESRVHVIAQEVLDEQLGPGDVYRAVDDASFQICFETSDEDFARDVVQRASALIDARIESELSGAEGEISVDGFAASVPVSKVRNVRDPLAALHSSLLDIRNEVNSRTHARHDFSALRLAGMLFQPLWCSNNFGQTINRCLLDTITGATAEKYLGEIGELDDLVAALADLDSMVFGKSVEGLHGASGEHKQASILIPVHFQSLAQRAPEFMKMAMTLPRPYRRFVLLDLIGVPAASSSGELRDTLQTGRAVADRIVLQLSPTDERVDQNVRDLIWGVSVNLGEIDIEDAVTGARMEAVAQTAAEYGLGSFAYGANTIGKAASVVQKGFDYVGGPAVAHTSTTPRSHARFTPLFGDTAPRPNAPEHTAGLREHQRFAPLNPHSTVTLPSGSQYPCRVPNVSASGAVIVCDLEVKVQDYLVIGSIPGQVVRITRRGFAVKFLEVQQASVVEIALQTPVASDRLLASLRLRAA